MQGEEGLGCPCGGIGGQVKVREARAAVLSDEDVLRLHVAVNHSMAMKMNEPQVAEQSPDYSTGPHRGYYDPKAGR